MNNPFGEACYSDLDAVETAIWSGLEAGPRSRDAFTTCTLSYLDPNVGITAKTWLLRGVDRAAHTLVFYTDARSAKVEAIAQNPQVALLFYHRGWLAQLSLRGRATVQRQAQLFGTMSTGGHVNYQTMPRPGDVLTDPTDAHRDETLGGENFRTVEVTIETLDWVWLAENGHRRVAFDYRSKPSKRQWLSP